MEAVVYLTVDRLSPMLMSVEPPSVEITTTFDENIVQKLVVVVWSRSNLSEAHSNLKAHFSSTKERYENALIALNEYSAWLIERNPDLATAQITQDLTAVVNLEWYLDKVIKRQFDAVWAIVHGRPGGLG
jgi:acyl-CoA synthetase (NDP forming)